ncbi:hypothetical protein, partial [Citrobacter freundii]|uniref:hypothetical protein n=1 Tax=Citrobacter freundii TaxID=546 RepID=UPI0019542B59
SCLWRGETAPARVAESSPQDELSAIFGRREAVDGPIISARRENILAQGRLHSGEVGIGWRLVERVFPASQGDKRMPENGLFDPSLPT